MKKINLNNVKYVKVMQGDVVYCFLRNCGAAIGYGKLCYYKSNSEIVQVNQLVIFEVHNNEFRYSEIKC